MIDLLISIVTYNNANIIKETILLPDFTELYSRAAIQLAPEINPAIQVISKVCVDAPLAAIPIIKLVTEIMPSLAPKTEALNHPVR